MSRAPVLRVSLPKWCLAMLALCSVSRCRALRATMLTGTASSNLPGDADGIYHPALFNDRLLLGLKGTMSEAELYVLRARLQGGILNKARRGALKLGLPIGFCYTETDQIMLDPHQQVQDTV